MDYKYSDFLPNYLDGDNIRNHAGNIEKQDKIIADKNRRLQNWNKLSPPLLIERVCVEDGDNIHITYCLHVSVDEFIEHIEIDNELLVSFPYSDAVMEYEDIILDEIVTSESFCNNPVLRVDVYTYADNVYSKGYPENDVHDETVFDHDENLDRVGALFGLERRTYNSYNSVDGADSIPAFFGKEDIEGVVQSCTEDDYYYLQRLLYLISHYQTMDLCKLYIYLIYNVDLEISHEYEKYEIQQGNFLYILDKNTRFAVNIDEPPLGQELSADPYLGKFIPVSREAYVLKTQTLYKIKKCIIYSSGWDFVVVTDMYDNPISDMTFDTRNTLHGTVTTNTNGEILICLDTFTSDYENVIWIYPLDTSYVPQTRDYSHQAAEERVIRDIEVIDRGTPLRREVRYDYCDVGCDSILGNIWCPRERQYFVSIPTPIGNVTDSEGIIFYVDETEEYKCPFIINEQMVTRLYVTPDSVCALNDLTILRTWNFTDDFTLGVYAEENNFHFQGFPRAYLSGDVPVPPTPPVTTTEYGLGTDNPWTSTLTNAIINNGIAWTYYQRTPALYSGIPLNGDFEITLLMGNDATGGSGSFGLSNISGTEVLMANINNTVNNVSVNTIFPTVNVDETITMKREGTTYTYKHGTETKTFTINNTETLYLKVNKTGNGSLYLKTMTVTQQE